VESDKGLFGGPVTAIATLPSDGAVVYAGTREDEIYASSDGGSDWTPLGGASSGHYVAGIELDPRTDGRIVGKAVYGVGFFLSEDGGRTWKKTQVEAWAAGCYRAFLPLAAVLTPCFQGRVMPVSLSRGTEVPRGTPLSCHSNHSP
jgi:hypothetical protein